MAKSIEQDKTKVKRATKSGDRRTSDATLRKLRRMIIAGQLDATRRLGGRSLAQKLGSSHASVRAALVRLEEEGYVESRPQSGTYLRTPSLKEILDLSAVREAIETPMAAHAALRRSESQAARLAEVRKQMTQLAEQARAGRAGAAELAAAGRLDAKMHDLVLEAADNEVAATIVARHHLFATFWRLSQMHDVSEPERQRRLVIQVFEMHVPIIDAVIAKNAEAAAAAMKSHFVEANRGYPTTLKEEVGS